MPRRRGPAPGRAMGRARRTRRRRRRRRVMLVGGMVAFGAHKMSQKDAKRIEEHTGVNPEELEDDELDQAMSELNIEKQTVTPEDLEQGGAPAAPEPAAAPADSPSDYIAELEKLASLRDSGILTDEEFEAKKRQILGLD